MFPPTHAHGMAEHRAAGDLGAGETTDDLLEALNERRRRLLELRHLRHDADDTAAARSRGVRSRARSRGATRGPYRGGAIPAPSSSRTTRARWPAHGASSSSISSSVPRGRPVSAKATTFERWASPTLTASGSPSARSVTSAAVQGPIPGMVRRAAARSAAPCPPPAGAGRPRRWPRAAPPRGPPRRSTTARRGSIPSATRRHGGIASTSAGAGAASSASGPGARFPCHRTRRR